MSAPQLRLHPDAAEAMARRVVEQDQTIQRLTEENDRLEDAKLSSELRTSVAMADLEARMSLRCSMLERRCMALERALDRTNNFAQGLPQRTEFDALVSRVDGLAARESV